MSCIQNGLIRREREREKACDQNQEELDIWEEGGRNEKWKIILNHSEEERKKNRKKK